MERAIRFTQSKSSYLLKLLIRFEVCLLLLAPPFVSAQSNREPDSQTNVSSPSSVPGAAANNERTQQEDEKDIAVPSQTDLKDTTAASTAPGNRVPSDAKVKAERRRRFEEELKRLEEKEDTVEVRQKTDVYSDSLLTIWPAEIGMLIGDKNEFYIANKMGKKVDVTATWSSSNPSVVALSGDDGVIVAKSEGTAIITAQVGDSLTKAKVTVYPGTRMPPGAVIWGIPLPGGSDGRPPKLVPAIPFAR